MADEQGSNIVVRSKSRFLKMASILYPMDISNTSAPEVLTEHLGSYSKAELSNMPGFAVQDPGERQDQYSLYSTLLDTTSNTASIVEKLKNFRTLSPEIPLTKLILVSSIISPNDMQTDLVAVGNTDKTIDDETRQAVCQLVGDHFNDVLHFGEKLQEWIGVALVDKGAIGVIVLPQATNRMLNSVVDAWDPTKNAALESFQLDLADFDPATENWQFTDLLRDASMSLEGVVPGMEALGEKDRVKLISGLAESSMKLLKDSGDAIFVSRDISEIRRGTAGTRRRMTEIMRAAEQSISSVDPREDQAGVRPREPIFSMSDIMDQFLQEDDMPSIVEWPTEAIIPAVIPGTHERIGCYLIAGSDGFPLKADPNAQFTPAASVERLAYNAMKATYGSQTIQTVQMMKLSEESQFNATSTVFTVAVKHLLESKLDKMGLHGLDVSLHSAIGKSIFYNLLRKSKIKLIFVPEPLMMYYAFDYRDNGTGKSILEDIEFILALRTTFVVANVMAAIENSTKHIHIDVDVDEKNQNAIQTLDMVRRKAILKYAPKFTTNLQQASESILNSHIHIKARNVNGTNDNLNVNTETRGGSAPQPDSTMMDNLNNWVGLGLFVSPSQLNQLSESEYSRSVATTNITFSNRVRLWQNKLHPINCKFIQNYVRNHAGLLKQLREILTGQDKDTEDVKESDLAPDIDRKDDSVDAKLRRLIAGFEINLPKPNVATSKAHYEELRSFMDSVEQIVQKRYPDEMAQSDDERKQLAALRGALQSDMIKDYMENLGYHQLANIPDTDEMILDTAVHTSLFLKNFDRKMKSLDKLTNPGGDEENAGGLGY